MQEAIAAVMSFPADEEGTTSPRQDDAQPPPSQAATTTSDEPPEEETGHSSRKTDEKDEDTTTTTPPSPHHPVNSHRNNHPAIEKTVKALILVMNHYHSLSSSAMTNNHHTHKSIELALETTTSITSNRYLEGTANGNNEAQQQQQEILPLLLDSVSKCSDLNVETVQVALIRTLRTLMTSPKIELHDQRLVVAFKTTFHVYLVTKSQSCKDVSRAALLDMLRAIFSRMEAYEAVERSKAMKPKEEPMSDPVLPDYLSQYHNDAYALFRALCKLSAKDLPADNVDEADRARIIFNTNIPTDPMVLNSKILALELIFAAMDFCGDAICNDERFIALVKQHLCVSLLKNCMSSHTQIAYSSQKIFLVLVYKFKGHLRDEIEVFLSNIFIRVLDSPNSSFKQKAVVLESLRSLCSDPVLLTQIFLNYDCDFDAMDLYKEIVHILTKLGGRASVSQPATATKKEIEQEYELSLAGIEVLVTILKAFLKALGLPGGGEDDDEERDESNGSRIRGMLQLDVGLAAKPVPPKSSAVSATSSIVSDDVDSGGILKEGETEKEGIDAAGKIVNAFQQKRNAQQSFEIGAVKFTLSLKSGLNYFIENDFIERDARSVAQFFLTNKDRLDKTQMGEALGRETDAALVKEEGLDAENGGAGFWVRILHHYVDLLDFTGLMFDEAIRLFLSGFRLPGEAQKIDRIMEKFAEKFTSQNPDIFPSADTAFILAFSVIMLNTDLHNPSIKPERRMTIDSFIRNNRGIGDNGADLPNEFLEGIFNRIKERPFSLKEDDAAREKASNQSQIFDTSVFFEGPSLFGPSSADEKRRERFKQEREEILAATEQLIRRKPDKESKTSGGNDSLAASIPPSEVVRPMFDVTWGAILGTLSQVLECVNDDRSVAVCLNGFMYAVRIASHSRMSLARDTFVSSLAKFTYLGSIKEMKSKNVESIRTLLSIAVIDGEHLGESWSPVLKCISQVVKLRLSASGLDSDENFLIDRDSPRERQTQRKDLFRSSRPEASNTEESNGRVVLEAVQEVLIDKVFSSSRFLSAQSLAYFIEQMIDVASSEISGKSTGGITGVQSREALDSSERSSGSSRHNPSKHGGGGPSIFFLQRLVEVADYNMDIRPRLVWAQVWDTMADFFAEVACHKNGMVSAFAIDALRQLSFKFLEKPELSEFNFQRVFLRPFLLVMENPNSREDTRELVLQCIDNMVRTKSANLKSGWKVIFSILKRSSNDPSEKVDHLGLGILQTLLDEHLEELFCIDNNNARNDVPMTPLEKKNRNSHADDFVSLCNASLSFVQMNETGSPRPLGLSMRAFCHTALYADLLGSDKVHHPVSGYQCDDPSLPGYTYRNLQEKEALEMVLWRPLLDGLARGISSSSKTSSGGVGCLIQRGSVLALRSILLRHGYLFSSAQLAAILEQSLIPAIRTGIESDTGPVITITSESPSVSNIDFLVESPPLPPSIDDVSLLRFEALNSSKRSMGVAELMLEASFSDLRHGGDGDLRRAYVLAKKAATVDMKPVDQPFPESFIATTAPLALGLLTDVCSELGFDRGHEGNSRLWPPVVELLRRYTLGAGGEFFTSDSWRPCEALVRIACRELDRIFERLAARCSQPDNSPTQAWTSEIVNELTFLLESNSAFENEIVRELSTSKRKSDEKIAKLVTTPFGRGQLIGSRIDDNLDTDFNTEIFSIQLEFGAMLYTTVLLSDEVGGDDDFTEKTTESSVAGSERANGIPLEVNGKLFGIFCILIISEC